MQVQVFLVSNPEKNLEVMQVFQMVLFWMNLMLQQLVYTGEGRYCSTHTTDNLSVEEWKLQAIVSHKHCILPVYQPHSVKAFLSKLLIILGYDRA